MFQCGLCMKICIRFCNGGVWSLNFDWLDMSMIVSVEGTKMLETWSWSMNLLAIGKNSSWPICGKLLGGSQALGPKSRRYDMPLSSQPDKAEWETFFAQSGPQGGRNATPCSLGSRFSTNVSEPPHVQWWSADAALSLAKGDLHRMARSLFSQPLRKAVPFWSVPVEVWRLLFFPNWYLSAPKFGIGAQQLEPGAPNFHQLFLQFLAQVRSHDHKPLAWQTSLEHKIATSNRKDGCAGLRVVNCLDPVGKALYAQLWQHGCPRSQRHNASGYSRHCLGLTPWCNSTLLAIGCAKQSSRIANVFWMLQMLSTVPITAAWMQQWQVWPAQKTAHWCSSVTGMPLYVFQLGMSMRVFIHGQVPFKVALQLRRFLEIHHPQIDVWNADLPQDPICNFLVDVSLATYADDVSKIVTCNDATDLAKKVHHLNQKSDEALQAVGLAQNKAKQEHVPFFAGEGARTNYQQSLEQQVCQASARAVPHIWGADSITWILWRRSWKLDTVQQESVGPRLGDFGHEVRCRKKQIAWYLHALLCLRFFLAWRRWCSQMHNYIDLTVLFSHMVASSCAGLRVPKKSLQMAISNSRLARLARWGIFCGWFLVQSSFALGDCGGCNNWCTVRCFMQICLRRFLDGFHLNQLNGLLFLVTQTLGPDNCMMMCSSLFDIWWWLYIGLYSTRWCL